VLQREHEERHPLTRKEVERRRRLVQLRRHLDVELPEDAFERVEPNGLLVEQKRTGRLAQNCPTFVVETLGERM
jgi:hypothetical protein